MIERSLNTLFFIFLCEQAIGYVHKCYDVGRMF